MCNKVYIHAEWGWHVSGKKLAKDFFRKLINQEKKPGVIWLTNILHRENIHISPFINVASVAGLLCLHCCCESTVLDRPSALQSLEAIPLLWAIVYSDEWGSSLITGLDCGLDHWTVSLD